MKKILLLIIFITLSSCGPNASQKTEMKVSFGAASSDFPGGIFVIGKHRQSGVKFSHQLGSSQIDLNLINGTWDFVAVGWEGAANFSGNIKCGKKFGVGLFGNPVEVNLNLNSGACSGAVAGSFNPANNEPYPMKVHSCGLFGKRKEYASPDADLVYLCDEIKGNHQSFKVVWYEFSESLNPFAAKYNPMKTACVAATNGVSTFTNYKIPLFAGAWGLPTTVEAFNSNDCSGSPQLFHFPQGLATQTTLGASKADGTNIHTMITDNICVGSQLTQESTFANGLDPAGTFAAEDLAVICNPGQFALIANQNIAIGNLRFILGKDIDFSGVSAFNIGTNGNPFTADFDGLGFSLKNYSNTETLSNSNSRGIFDYVQSASIKNLKLENIDFDFTLPSSATMNVGVGLLVGTLKAKGTSGRESSFENISFDAYSSLIFTNTYTSGYANNITGGALIGSVIRGSSNPEDVLISNITSYTPVTYEIPISNGPNSFDYTGGVIGDASSSNSYPKLTLEKVSVTANITGGAHVGGMIGWSNNTIFKHSNHYTGTISAAHKMGGLIGTSGNTKIMNSSANVTFSPVDMSAATPSVAKQFIGGIIGYMDSGSTINGAVSNMTLNSNLFINDIGGITGYIQSNSVSSLILNSRAEVNITNNGFRIGGIAGDVVNLSGVLSIIQYNSVVGSIKEKTSGNGSWLGGLAGRFKGEAKMNIIDIDIEGSSKLGGIVGENLGKLSEMYVKGTITSATTGANLKAGAVVGVQGNETGTALNNIISDVDLDVAANCSTDGSNQCGLITGSMPVTTNISNSNFLNVLTRGSIYVSGTAQTSPPLILAGTFVSSPLIDFNSTNLTTNESAFDDVSGIITDYDNSAGDVDIELIFKRKWDQWGLASKTLFATSGVSYYKTGSFAAATEPFIINSTTAWNSIGDDAFLMAKSFKLGNNLDFNSNASNFIPIGSNTNPYKGVFVPNNYKLKNIKLAPVNTVTGLGVFNYVGVSDLAFSPIIGLPNDPLVVENLQISTVSVTASEVGLIGNALSAQITARVSGSYSATPSAAVNFWGGIIGYATNVDVINSSFSGSINVGGSSSNIGGMIGELYQDDTNHKSSIRNSKVRTHLIKGDNHVGGLIGKSYNDTNGGLTKINNNYVDIIPDPNGNAGKIEATTAANKASGLVSVMDAAGETKISNNYITLLNGASIIGDNTNALAGQFGYPNSYSTYNNNFVVNGATSNNNTDISIKSSLNEIIEPLNGHPWVYNSTDGSLKLFWERTPPPINH